MSHPNRQQFKHLMFGRRFRFVNPSDGPARLGGFDTGWEYRKVGHKRCAVALGSGVGRGTFACSPNVMVDPIYEEE